MEVAVGFHEGERDSVIVFGVDRDDAAVDQDHRVFESGAFCFSRESFYSDDSLEVWVDSAGDYVFEKFTFSENFDESLRFEPSPFVDPDFCFVGDHIVKVSYFRHFHMNGDIEFVAELVVAEMSRGSRSWVFRCRAANEEGGGEKEASC